MTEYKDNSLRNWSICAVCIVIPLIVFLIIGFHDESLRQSEIKKIIEEIDERIYARESCEKLTERLNIDNQYWLKEKDEVLNKIYKEKCEGKK